MSVLNQSVQEGNYPYTLAKGFLMVKKDGESDDNWLDLGNAESANANIATENLTHDRTREGINIQDRSSTTKQTGNMTINLDVPNIQNMEIFLMASAIIDSSQISGSITDQEHTAKLGKSIYVGFQDLSSVVVKDNSDVVLTLNTDYIVRPKDGIIAPIEGGAISDGDTIKVSASYGAVTIKKLEAGTANNIKRHIWYVGNAAQGVKQYIKGFGNIRPNGDMVLVGDAWQVQQLAVEFESHPDYAGIFDYYDNGTIAAS